MTVSVAAPFIAAVTAAILESYILDLIYMQIPVNDSIGTVNRILVTPLTDKTVTRHIGVSGMTTTEGAS
jgi:hypothetical protein